MAETTGIGWTMGTVNFWIGCTEAGPGCDGCYARNFAKRKFGVIFGHGQPRHRTKAGYENPLKWQRMHDRGQTHMKVDGEMVPVPTWVFACSLADMFDNEIPKDWRADAWKVIRATPSLRWQLVTKRPGNVPKMLPSDWNDGIGYEHVGIVATMVNQAEINRDMLKLLDLRVFGVKWIGLSIEPQLGPISLIPPGGAEFFPRVDWIITGGESKQDDHPNARPYDLAWPRILVSEGAQFGVPVFVKQMGDHPVENGQRLKFKGKGDNPQAFPRDLRVQQMPRIYPDTVTTSRVPEGAML